jgi:drug/metabolite transporter (DMT)-like permease
LNSSYRHVILGLCFALLWGSAATAGKIGFSAADPLVIFLWRFLIAGVLIVGFVHGVRREPWPSKHDWGPILFFALLNTTLYLGLFAIALKHIAAGIATLSVALNPLLIAILSSLKKRQAAPVLQWISIVLGTAGVGMAVYPIMNTVHANMLGVGLLGLSMGCYSLAAVYFSGRHWRMSTLSANGWQALLGGMMFIPLTMLFQTMPTVINVTFWGVLLWLVVPVSIISIQIWLYLVKQDPVYASMWLYLCPVFGFALSWLLLGEPFTIWTCAGTALVIVSVYIGTFKFKPRKVME